MIGSSLKIDVKMGPYPSLQEHSKSFLCPKFYTFYIFILNKKRRNATKPGFQRFNQVLIWQE